MLKGEGGNVEGILTCIQNILYLAKLKLYSFKRNIIFNYKYTLFPVTKEYFIQGNKRIFVVVNCPRMKYFSFLL